MSDLAKVTSTLEQCAELDVDLTPIIYAGFFERCPGAIPLMGHSDEHMRGRMAEQVFELIMDDSLQGAGNYLRWEVENHVVAYAVDVDMYADFFDAVQDAVAQTLGSAWQQASAQAWERRIASLLNDIHTQAQASLAS